MLIDPHIALIRTPAVDGAGFYEAVMQRVAERTEQPRGVLLHFAFRRAGDLVVATIFRDRATMQEGFTSFSARETQSEIAESGRARDVTRDEYRLEQLQIETGIDAHPFAFIPSGEIAAASSELIAPSLETYRTVVFGGGWFDAPVDGRIAHIAYSTPNGVIAIGFWRTREHGKRWYREHLQAALEELDPGRLTDQDIRASWLDLHSFVVIAEAGDPTRNFVREEAGPTSV